MGINCSDIRQVIHWGVPQDAEVYVQESGRAGRDGKHSIAMIMKKGCDLNKRYTSEEMTEYCQNRSLCRRSILYKGFLGCELPHSGCVCCDICKFSCACENCDSLLNTFHIPVTIQNNIFQY